MKKDVEKIDELIKEALTQEEAKFYDDLDEQSVFEMIGGLFQGKLKWLILLMDVINLVFLALFIYCVIQFLDTDVTNDLIQWAVAGVICLMVMGMIKLFAWMQMDKNALMRELKRLELQVSALSGQVSGK